MDVEVTTTIRQAEVGAAKMLDRTGEQFEVATSRLVADAGYGSAKMVGWLVDERGIEPHVKLMDKSSARTEPSPVSQLRLRFRGQPLCLSRRQRAEEISSLIPQARRADEGRHDDLLRAQAGLPRLPAEAPMLQRRQVD
jgi:DDE superfamily endonuclease